MDIYGSGLWTVNDCDAIKQPNLPTETKRQKLPADIFYWASKVPPNLVCRLTKEGWLLCSRIFLNNLFPILKHVLLQQTRALRTQLIFEKNT